MAVQQPQFAVANHDVAFLDLNTAIANGFDFPAFQHNTRLVLLFNEVIKTCFFVVNNAHEFGENVLWVRRSVKNAKIESLILSPSGKQTLQHSWPL